ncbi:MetQ/NlpA family ABC transporter substrate-binding protein [Rossellomorea aquimaris]|jgi:D-methionine transport system substrate-binding protein|uniref:Lipoprotein n=1 Tax=Rossellomorea aquimaris TaxID=189382 RepID=A0A5D4UJ24_9BACI|nr:MetQ/NlpA family ABC transporter substrate-binding protein [Rossellomorea aquimaris]TYS75665.1 MetQ/NlpA family ABC transporter substrate-binding protein [Rossellomorea aquimaris]TYS87234.1 MetQ/NlpA family ABC transporter substrate-binding protein [Rossellomorea aquimaris]
MKKSISLASIAILLITLILSGCSGDSASGSGEKEVVKVGVNGSGVPIWEYMKEKAAKEGIEIEIVEFADYVRPNQALADGDIDLNAFQTISYFDSFVEEHNLDLVPIGSTIIAPMGIYSETYKSVEDLPKGSKVAVPQEATNLGRALLLLEEAGLIQLKEGFDQSQGLEAIKENPKNLEFTPVVAAQTPRVLPDVAASIINNGVAVEAGFVPVDDSIYIEGAESKPFINIIAAQEKEKDNKTYKKIVELYQEDDVAEHIKKTYKDSLIPTFVPVSELH